MSALKTFRIKRQAGPSAQPYWAEYQIELAPRMCVLDALDAINRQIMMAAAGGPGGPGAGGPAAGGPVAFAHHEEAAVPAGTAGGLGGPGAGGPGVDKSAHGVPPAPVMSNRSCCVRKCGACALVVNGKPGLACGIFVEDLPGDIVTLEPLSKFPVVQDLVVDRSALQEVLTTMEVWPHGSSASSHDEKNAQLRFESARCLHCGCCLEACPNFAVGGQFSGPMSITNAFRIYDGLREDKILRKEYRQLCREHISGPCSHALTCAEVCPASIPVTNLLAHINRR